MLNTREMNRVNCRIKSRQDNKLFFNWGWNTLQYGPIMQINNFNMVYPTGQQILNIPMSWVA